MKLRLLGLALATTMLASTSAVRAADISGPPPVEDLRPSYDWTGPYIGVIGGLTCMNRGSLTDNTNAVSYEMSGCGGKAGVIGGYNYQINNVVVGVEGDYEWGQKNWIKNGDPTAMFGYDLTGIGTIRGRLGWAVDHTMLFVTGGAAYGKGKLHAINGFAAPTPISNKHWGWTVGGGVEQAVTDNLHVRLDYLYTHMNSKDYNAACCTTTVKWGGEHEVRVGATWNFGTFW